MSDTPKVSRRDWFRLRIPSQTRRLGANEAKLNQSGGLQNIEHPPNHGGMNLEELPPLREAILSDQEVAALIDDIDKHASEIQLMQRRSGLGSRANVSPSSSLSAAKDFFLSGRVNRLQVRYRWQDALWIDTLARQDANTRLIRVAHRDGAHS